MNEVVIVSACRTPIGSIRGALSNVRPDDLAAIAIAEAVRRSGVGGEHIEEVIFGCANQAGEDNRNVARMAALLAGLPQTVGGVTVNRLCASGLSAINFAARAIAVGEGDCYVAGGVESMTRAPYSVPKNTEAFGPSGNVTGWDTTLGWRYPNSSLQALFPLEQMGETAENIVDLSMRGDLPGGPITREDQDQFAFQSQVRAIDAINSGRFNDELVPVPIRYKGKPAPPFDTDEYPRMQRMLEPEFNSAYDVTDRPTYKLTTSLVKLAALNSVFRLGGTVTAGNSSGLNDGAAALVMMSAPRARKLGVAPLARWVASATAGVDPRVMGLGPISAVQKVCGRSGISVTDLDLVELNEAFAAQAIAVVRGLGLSSAITNVNGGAIALGHPLGCSGARIVTTLIHELLRRKRTGEKVKYGLATLCVGVGQGEATVISV